MKSNTLTIIKKEFARFFGDRQLLFTTVIMPGLLIYIIYSLMGTGIQSMITEGQNEVVTMRVENMPESLAPVFNTMDSSLVVVQQPISEADIAQLEDKEINAVLVRFPEHFEEAMAGMQAARCLATSAAPSRSMCRRRRVSASTRPATRASAP